MTWQVIADVAANYTDEEINAAKHAHQMVVMQGQQEISIQHVGSTEEQSPRRGRKGGNTPKQYHSKKLAMVIAPQGQTEQIKTNFDEESEQISQEDADNFDYPNGMNERIPGTIVPVPSEDETMQKPFDTQTLSISQIGSFKASNTNLLQSINYKQ